MHQSERQGDQPEQTPGHAQEGTEPIVRGQRDELDSILRGLGAFARYAKEGGTLSESQFELAKSYRPTPDEVDFARIKEIEPDVRIAYCKIRHAMRNGTQIRNLDDAIVLRQAKIFLKALA